MSVPDTLHPIENKTHAEISVDDHAESIRTLKPQDIELFAVMSGYAHPAQFDAQ